MPLAFTNCTLYFLTKWLFLIFSSMPEPLQDPVCLRYERFADMEARKTLTLKELNGQPLLRH